MLLGISSIYRTREKTTIATIRIATPDNCSLSGRDPGLSHSPVAIPRTLAVVTMIASSQGQPSTSANFPRVQPLPLHIEADS